MAGSPRTVARNSLLIAAGLVIGSASSLVFRVLVARVYGPENFGVFSIGFMVVTATTTLALLGFPAGATKFVSEYRSLEAHDRVLAVLGFCLAVSLPLSLLLTGSLFLFARPLVQHSLGSAESAGFLRWFALQIPANVLIHLSAAFALGRERGGTQVVIREVLPKSLLLAFAAGVVVLGGSIIDVGLAYVAARWVAGVLGLLAVLYLVRYADPRRVQISHIVDEAKPLFIYSSPLLLTTFTGFLLNWVDTFFVAYFLDEARVGIYQTAFILGSVLGLFFTAISNSMFPNLSALLSRNDTGEAAHRYGGSIRWGLIVSVAPFSYMVLFPGTTLRILFGPEYLSAALPLVVILVGQIVMISFGPGLGALKASGDTTFILAAYVVSTGVNIVGNVALIPRLGILGAAIATALSTALLGLLFFMKSRAVIGVGFPVTDVARIAAAGAGSVVWYRLR
jgi:O-antigen/teichoic acid export membrane protein